MCVSDNQFLQPDTHFENSIPMVRERRKISSTLLVHLNYRSNTFISPTTSVIFQKEKKFRLFTYIYYLLTVLIFFWLLQHVGRTLWLIGQDVIGTVVSVFAFQRQRPPHWHWPNRGWYCWYWIIVFMYFLGLCWLCVISRQIGCTWLSLRNT